MAKCLAFFLVLPAGSTRCRKAVAFATLQGVDKAKSYFAQLYSLDRATPAKWSTALGHSKTAMDEGLNRNSMQNVKPSIEKSFEGKKSLSAN